MIIAGGTYGERCHYPRWDQIYGSGLRAAVAVANVSPGSTLHTYAPSEWADDIKATLNSFGLRGELTSTGVPITFSYLHTFERMEIAGINHSEPLLRASGPAVLRFGMIEGDAKVEGDRVVFDRQSSQGLFQHNGSRAGSLAQIATREEVLSLARDHGSELDRLREGVIALREMTSTLRIVLVKDGLGGLTLFEGDDDITVPSYAVESYFRIGAGDVIAAAFAHGWAELHLAPSAAAEYAARSVAYFVEGPRLPLPPPAELSNRIESAKRKENIRIVGIGDFEVQALLRRTEDWMRALGKSASYWALDAASPIPNDAGDLILVGTRATRGQLEEIARATSRPLVVFWPGSSVNLANELFPNAVIATDYATALYHALRSA